MATIVLGLRVLTYFQASPRSYPLLLRILPLGIIVMLLAYLGFVLALQFVHVSIPGDAHWEAIGIRAGWLSIGQIPLVILLAGKCNIIGFLTGVGYERLNVIHRWVARVLLLTATLHFGYQSYGWNRLGLWQLEWATDTCTPTGKPPSNNRSSVSISQATGMAAYVLLIWINVSTMAPLRNLFYEFFVIQHLLTFFGFIIAIMYHLPHETAPSVRTYIWVTIGLYLADRMIRSFFYMYNNRHPGKATLTCLPNNVTKISIKNPHIKKWSPGAFALLSIPRFGLGESHPATIASTPTSSEGELVFFLRAHRGFTQRLAAQAKSDVLSQTALPLNHGKRDSNGKLQGSEKKTYLALVDGPYGGIGTDFTAFDTAVLIAASTGVTFTLPVLLDLAHRTLSEQHRLPLRKVTFVWIIKDRSSKDWISSEINLAIQALRNAGVDATAQIYVTSNYPPNDSTSNPSLCPCECSDMSQDRCYCLTDRTPKASETALVNEKQYATSKQASTLSVSAHLSLTAISMHLGRPNTRVILSNALGAAEGEMGVGLCGPPGLSQRVRRDVVVLNAKGLGGPGVYLHTEDFGW